MSSSYHSEESDFNTGKESEYDFITEAMSEESDEGDIPYDPSIFTREPTFSSSADYFGSSGLTDDEDEGNDFFNDEEDESPTTPSYSQTNNEEGVKKISIFGNSKKAEPEPQNDMVNQSQEEMFSTDYSEDETQDDYSSPVESEYTSAPEDNTQESSTTIEYEDTKEGETETVSPPEDYSSYYNEEEPSTNTNENDTEKPFDSSVFEPRVEEITYSFGYDSLALNENNAEESSVANTNDKTQNVDHVNDDVTSVVTDVQEDTVSSTDETTEDHQSSVSDHHVSDSTPVANSTPVQMVTPPEEHSTYEITLSDVENVFATYNEYSKMSDDEKKRIHEQIEGELNYANIVYHMMTGKITEEDEGLNLLRSVISIEDPLDRAFTVLDYDNDNLMLLGAKVEEYSNIDLGDPFDKIKYARRIVYAIGELDQDSLDRIQK